jgi:hypothetical protein
MRAGLPWTFSLARFVVSVNLGSSDFGSVELWPVNELRKFDPAVCARLKTIGEAVDAGGQALVFDEGFVGINDEHESEVISDVPQGQASRPSARSRAGQRAASRSRGRAPGKAEPFRSPALEAAHGAGFRLLAQHYEALSFEDRNGLWVAVRTKPLGSGGPQAHLLVAAPVNRAITPRAWAFSAIGPSAKLFPLKHTNFPDASICAFTKASSAWTAEDGLLPLIDHYSLWVAKSWHRQLFGWWPGEQVGACALYRRMEFVEQEWCGCGSGRRYADCHRGPDMLVCQEAADQEFRRLFMTDYQTREPPANILEAARSAWKKLPDMASTFGYRFTYDEPMIPLL